MSFVDDARQWIADKMIGEGEAENKKIYNAFEKIKEPHEKDPKKQDYEKMGVSEYELVQQSQFYYNSIYFTASDKEKMMKEYREMANYPEVADALDDICDEGIAQDEEGEVMHLQVNNEKILQNENIMKNLQAEYDYCVNLVDFHNNAFTLFRKFYVEAELFAEMVINPDKPTEGLKKVVMLPPETMFVDYDEYEQVKGFRQRIDPNDERVKAMTSDSADKRGIIFMKNTQVAYVNSGIFTKNQTDEKIVLSYMERAKVAYRQLKWMEDSLVIYRIVRSPERRVFYIDVGNLPKKKAEEYMNEIIRRYRQRKVYNPQTGEVDVGRNVLAMTEDFWLPKRGDQGGTKIEPLMGGANLGEIGDVLYFQKKLYKALKVPAKRAEESGGLYQYQGHENSDTRDEIKFAKYVQRVRTRFIDWFIEIFRTHLKLKGMWDQYGLSVKDFHFIFNEENEWRETKELQNWTTRIAVYREMLEFENKDFSRTWLKKNVLRMSDEQIEENDEAIIEDAKKHLKMDDKINKMRAEYGVGPDGLPAVGPDGQPVKPGEKPDPAAAQATGAPKIDQKTGQMSPPAAAKKPKDPRPFWAKGKKPAKKQLNT